MAEGLARATAPDGWKVFSAGSHPAKVSRAAVAVMREVGIDISRHQSKGMDQVPLETADLIVTLCAQEVCPVVPGAVKRLHWPLEDPGQSDGTNQEQLAAFRKTRDEIASRLDELWKSREESVTPAFRP